MCWQGVKFKTPLTGKHKPTKNPEKGEKHKEKTDSGGLQSTPSILKPYSTIPEEENESKEEKINERIVEYKQSIDGIDCDPLIAVPLEEKKEAILQNNLKEDAGFKKFQAGMKKRHCLMCGEHFSYDLGIQWQDGYICARCHREGPPSAPVKPDSQTTLGKDEVPA